MSVVQVIPIYASTRKKARYFIETLPNNIPLEMVEIPAGSFVMGAPESEKESRDNERPQRDVSVPTFCMGKYPITQAQWGVVATLPQINQELRRRIPLVYMTCTEMYGNGALMIGMIVMKERRKMHRFG